MKKIKINLKRTNGTLMIPVPDPVGEMMGWDDGDLLEVAFHEINKIPVKEELVVSPEATGKKEVIVKFGTHEPKSVKQSDVIEILENPTPDLNIYRTTYFKWKGKKYGVKNVCKKLFGHNEFNTQTGAKYLQDLGFPTFHE
ncbi:Uncharacterised protein [uncultured archaeon]|nr:Uncharacterised protein [uncultured archaeon]